MLRGMVWLADMVMHDADVINKWGLLLQLDCINALCIANKIFEHRDVYKYIVCR